MIYEVLVEHYQEWNGAMKTNHMFVCANTSKEAVGKITDYFGEEYVESFSVSAFSPDDFLMVDGKDYDRMDEVILPFIYDEDTETVKNAGPDSNVVREGAVSMWFYSGRGQSVYDFFKSKYMEMYPDARIDDYSSEEYDQYNIYGQNNEVIRIRIDHFNSCKKVSVHECVFKK